MSDESLRILVMALMKRHGMVISDEVIAAYLEPSKVYPMRERINVAVDFLSKMNEAFPSGEEFARQCYKNSEFVQPKPEGYASGEDVLVVTESSLKNGDVIVCNNPRHRDIEEDGS